MRESNLLFTDTSSTYGESLGLSWKDLASFGTLIAALLLPRFLIPLFSQAEPFQRLYCLLFASRQASPACRCSLSCGCLRDGEAPAGPSNPLAGRAAGSSKNAETCANQSGPVRHEFPQEVSEFAGSSTAIVAFTFRIRTLPHFGWTWCVSQERYLLAEECRLVSFCRK